MASLLMLVVMPCLYMPRVVSMGPDTVMSKRSLLVLLLPSLPHDMEWAQRDWQKKKVAGPPDVTIVKGALGVVASEKHGGVGSSSPTGGWKSYWRGPWGSTDESHAGIVALSPPYSTGLRWLVLRTYT